MEAETNTQPQATAVRSGLKTILNTTEAQDNAREIVLSNNTKTLIMCRARMSDVWNDVYSALEATWGDIQAEKEMEKFNAAYDVMNNELLSLITEVMAETMGEENFKQM